VNAGNSTAERMRKNRNGSDQHGTQYRSVAETNARQ
jgi:hypothetical protein